MSGPDSQILDFRKLIPWLVKIKISCGRNLIRPEDTDPCFTTREVQLLRIYKALFMINMDPDLFFLP